MKINTRSYRNTDWLTFSEKIKTRDHNQCLKCGRNNKEAILQVHHKLYKIDLKPWEYSTSDCITLCKGCHAIEHKKVEPTKGWTLISIKDLGGLYGTCERIGCGHEIRHEHEIYNPEWGYKIVGSTCVEYLTDEDKWLSSEILKIFNNISKFVHDSIWEPGLTKSGKEFISTTYKHHQLRIYDNENNNSIQIALKAVGEKWPVWNKPIYIKNKSRIQMIEMVYIILKGTISESQAEKNILRNIYTDSIKFV